MDVTKTTVTARELGAVLGLTDRRVRQLAEGGAFPREGRGRYLLAACVQAYVALVAIARDGLDIAEARRRKVAAEADLLELELASERQETVRVEDVGNLVAQEYATVRARFLVLPSKLAPILAAESSSAACKSHLEAAVREALANLSAEGDLGPRLVSASEVKAGA